MATNKEWVKKMIPVLVRWAQGHGTSLTIILI